MSSVSSRRVIKGIHACQTEKVKEGRKLRLFIIYISGVKLVLSTTATFSASGAFFIFRTLAWVASVSRARVAAKTVALAS